MSSDGATSGPRRKPSWRERENNRRRERRRRAVAAKIYTGLRAQGHYNLPKHCDNNEVLKALCREAGWIVEEDGTTYRKGCKPPPLDIVGSSSRVTPYTSQNASPLYSSYPSPFASCQVSPTSSSFPSPSRDDGNNQSNMIPFFFNGIASLPSLRISNSAPVTPPISSPTSRAPQPIPNWESIARETMVSFNYAASAPTSPTHRQFRAPAPIPECNESDASTVDSTQWINFQRIMPSTVPTSPTYNLVQPAVERLSLNDEVNGRGPEFEFGREKLQAWQGERIHEVAMEDLELTLGTGSSRN